VAFKTVIAENALLGTETTGARAETYLASPIPEDRPRAGGFRFQTGSHPRSIAPVSPFVRPGGQQDRTGGRRPAHGFRAGTKV